MRNFLGICGIERSLRESHVKQREIPSLRASRYTMSPLLHSYPRRSSILREKSWNPWNSASLARSEASLNSDTYFSAESSILWIQAIFTEFPGIDILFIRNLPALIELAGRTCWRSSKQCSRQLFRLNEICPAVVGQNEKWSGFTICCSTSWYF